ncbi:MAG: FG-GAP-like repeat-containing protein [Alphaproteobacteria bacterium]|nr:FG-GAP-like repeat-containing protein [Alphaproteobacteria bacterium]
MNVRLPDLSQSKQGFSLIQMSILLSALAIIAVAIMPGGDSASNAEREATTRERMAAIEEATKSFMAAKLRRPCPASGQERFDSDSGTNENCSSFDFSSNRINVVAGTVPTATLGLSPEMGLDGYGRRMMYVVDKRAITTSTSTPVSSPQTCYDMTLHELVGEIQLADSLSDPPTDQVMWALISYGKDGHGAFRLTGSDISDRTNTVPSGTDEMTEYNAFDLSGSVGFGDAINSDITNGMRLFRAPSTATFDDLVWTDETTKNTCCLGRSCRGYGFRLERSDSTTANANTLRTAGSLSGPPPVITTITSGNMTTGDINGDGIQDIVISHTATRNGTPNTPSNIVYVVYGRKYGWQLPTSTTDRITLESLTNTTLTAAQNITAISSESPAVVTYSGADSFANGNTVYIDATTGTTSLNRRTFLISNVDTNNNTFELVGSNTRSEVHVSNTGTVRGFTGGLTGFRIEENSVVTSVAPNVGFGMTLAAGDINNDGFDDIVIGGGARFYVVFGAAVNTNLLTSNIGAGSAPFNGFIIRTYGWRELFPGAIAIGDVDGDGNKDILLTEDHQGVRDATNFGTMYVVYGKSGTDFGSAVTVTDNGASVTQRTVTLSSSIAHDVGFRLWTTNRTTDPLGANLMNTQSDMQPMAIGDLNNDGKDDLVIASGTTSVTRGLYIIWGRNRATTTAAATASASITAFGSGTFPGAATGVGNQHNYDVSTRRAAANRFDLLNITVSGFLSLGSSMHIADMDNDGIDDLLLANLRYAYIYYGKNNNDWTATGFDITSNNSGRKTVFDLYSLPAINGLSRSPNANMLAMDISAGDVNNDGRMDLIIGSVDSAVTNGTTTRTRAGIVVAFFQPATGFATTVNHTINYSLSGFVNGTTGIVFYGPDIHSSIRKPRLADINGDGVQDFIIAAPGFPCSSQGVCTVGTHTARGSTFVVFGRKQRDWTLQEVDLSPTAIFQ